MNARAKVQQVLMLSLLQELILASFDASYEAGYNYNTLEDLVAVLDDLLTKHLPTEAVERIEQIKADLFRGTPVPRSLRGANMN